MTIKEPGLFIIEYEPQSALLKLSTYVSVDGEKVQPMAALLPRHSAGKLGALLVQASKEMERR